MKRLLALLLLAPLAAVASASVQIAIKSPRPGATLHRQRPSEMVVQTPNNDTTAAREVSLVLSVVPCPESACPNAGDGLGTVLYAGPFRPVAPAAAPGAPAGPPEQAFQVDVPASFPVGPAELLATHFVLTGDNLSPLLQIAGEVVFVV
ncbi:uncharacterized protein MAM_06920 [Metarhizium album ARSEF 1941]|uniref:Phosphatidylglycerol/phosphatidylinositol transfer protein n=1 Tax=Metarhizium album (strain ARSEF 1941) TaxID=1081103 RepID=A0A0B2WNI3_METAS|nr:uncharacterized protein MAM_06920 [Metarhizium album ARSEF 1941]KHN95209.1 hypothetical protein MAM_06920 [Metarhizium album ARSEF 1941]